jgi:hypothetical protein
MTADDRRLLEVLAASEDGCTDALLTADGFKLDVLISIVSAGLATAVGGKGYRLGPSCLMRDRFGRQ